MGAQQAVKLQGEEPSELTLERSALGRHQLQPDRSDDGRSGEPDERHHDARQQGVVPVVTVVLDRVAGEQQSPRLPQQQHHFGLHAALDAGTGCVHTAPGHGREDYEVGLQYNLDIYSPVDDSGRFTGEVDFFDGQFVFEANRNINAKLDEIGAKIRLIIQDVAHLF